MPDLKTELEKVIHAWEQPEQPVTQPEPELPITMAESSAPAITFNEALFNAIRDNPGVTPTQLHTLVPYIQRASASPLISQMVKRHLVRRDGTRNGKLYAMADHYMTRSEQVGAGRHKHITSSKKRRAKRAESVQKQLDQLDMFEKAGMLTTCPVPTPVAPVATLAPQMRSVFDFDVESLTIAEARALRDKLNALFSA